MKKTDAARGKTRAQVALEFLMVLTIFYLILAWPMNHYFSLAASSLPEERQLEGIARGIASLTNRLCISSKDSYAKLAYEMPCFYRAGNETNYSVTAAGNAVNASAGNSTATKNVFCNASASFNASCRAKACLAAYNASANIILGTC